MVVDSIDTTPAPKLEWGYVSVPHPDETSSGDGHVLFDGPSGPLVAVMDGLGHGPAASTAVSIAADVLRRNTGAPLADLIVYCHEALRKSRGVAMTLAQINERDGTLTWAGIGNVEGRLLRAAPSGEHQDESVMLRGGVVGYQIPALRPSRAHIFPGDILIFATDGISPTFADGVILSDSPQWIAERIMTQHNRQQDDALVVVGRYLELDDG